MKTGDALRCALDNLSEHKLRSGLTMLGMMFGVGAVIAMLSIGAGAEKQALAMIDRMGVNNIVVRNEEPDPDQVKEIRKKSLGLSMRDVGAVREAIPGLAVVAPKLEIEPYKILSAGGKSEATVYGVSQDYARLASLDVEAGRFFDAADERDLAQVCVIGAATRRDLFGAGPAIGEHVKINDVWLEVIGVLGFDALSGGSFQGVSISTTARDIYVPFTTGLRKFEHKPLKSPLQEIIIRLEAGTSPYQTAALVDTLLARLHSGVRDYGIVVPEALLRQLAEAS